MNTSNQRHKQIAIDYLQASRTSRGYRYRAHETSSDWIVSARDMAKLGRMLATSDTSVDLDDSRSPASAYDRWASSTDAVEVSR